MATAKRPGGLYYVNGKAVDSEGNEVKGAPKQAPDTPPDQQPGANGVQTPEEKLANALAVALGKSPAKAAKGGE